MTQSKISRDPHPRFVEFIEKSKAITTHHLVPALPFDNLRKAQAAWNQGCTGMMGVDEPDLCKLSSILPRCRSYDPIAESYPSGPMQRANPFEGEHA